MHLNGFCKHSAIEGKGVRRHPSKRYCQPGEHGYRNVRAPFSCHLFKNPVAKKSIGAPEAKFQTSQRLILLYFIEKTGISNLKPQI